MERPDPRRRKGIRRATHHHVQDVGPRDGRPVGLVPEHVEVLRASGKGVTLDDGGAGQRMPLRRGLLGLSRVAGATIGGRGTVAGVIIG